jgi:hypothetical protein
MASEQIISAVIDEIVAAFDSDVAKFRAFLNRASLQAERDAIQSAIRNAQSEQSADIDAYNEQIEELTAELNAKQSEIDSL